MTNTAHEPDDRVQRELFIPPIYVKKGVGIQNVSIQHSTTYVRRAELFFNTSDTSPSRAKRHVRWGTGMGHKGR